MRPASTRKIFSSMACAGSSGAAVCASTARMVPQRPPRKRCPSEFGLPDLDWPRPPLELHSLPRRRQLATPRRLSRRPSPSALPRRSKSRLHRPKSSGCGSGGDLLLRLRAGTYEFNMLGRSRRFCVGPHHQHLTDVRDRVLNQLLAAIGMVQWGSILTITSYSAKACILRWAMARFSESLQSLPAFTPARRIFSCAQFLRGGADVSSLISGATVVAGIALPPW